MRQYRIIDNILHVYLLTFYLFLVIHEANIFSIMCVYSNSRTDVPRAAQRYGTIAAHTRRRASILVVIVVFCVHRHSFAGLIRRTPPPTFSDTAIIDRHSDSTIFQLRAHCVRISCLLDRKNRPDMCPRWESNLDFVRTKGWSGGPMVLGKLPVPGRPTIWLIVRQGPTLLAVGAGGSCLDIFTLLYLFSSLFPFLWETARYRLKYCLKGPLNPKQPTNQILLARRASYPLGQALRYFSIISWSYLSALKFHAHLS